MIALADRAQQRLHRRYSRMVMGRGQPVAKAVVACARELSGYLWAVLAEVPLRPAPQPTATTVKKK